MSSWEGKSAGSVLGYRIFVFFLRYTHWSVAYFILYFVAFYFWVFKRKTFKSSYRYFYQILGFTKSKSFFGVYCQYLSLGKTLLDKTLILSGLKHPFTIDHDGAEHFETIIKEGRGGMIISSHIGNWETAGQLLERINYTFNIVMVDAEHEKIKSYLGQVMGKRNFNIIPIKEDLSHVFLIKEALSRNELIVMHGDRYVGKDTARSMPFLGEQAYFPTGPFFIAAKFDVPVSFAFAMKETNTHYHFYASKPIRVQLRGNAQEKQQIVSGLMKKYIENLEKIIKKYPYQWFNFYEFWDR
ncbi:MAG: hypothetical protein JXR60_04490 [Bacteroidales bacterium]|nr:hypothetical protein [Bacteroidales bacterium]